MSNTHKTDNISRRQFLQRIAAGAAATGALAFAGCTTKRNSETGQAALGEVPTDQMTHRINPKTNEKVSILGYGCMRWPTLESGEIDQEMVNRLVDYAIEHGVNYFDTSPAYCKGMSERATGIALKRHPRNKFYVATKLSNFAQSTWSREASLAMYHRSFEELQVDHIDYMLLHSVGGGSDAMATFRARYIDNGMLDFLMAEREAGRIGNLGFSYHGDVAIFDHLLAQHDKYRWDFVQIQLNYFDWLHAKETNVRNTNAEYLYNELAKRNIPAVIMEPLLGGRLSNVHDHIATKLLQREPQRSVASWAFRFAGTFPGVLTVLSGMTYMEHLQDNLRTYSPLIPLNQDELDFLEETAQAMLRYPTIPCNDCQYCMPCPYGLDIPGIFSFYNKSLAEGNIATEGTVEQQEFRRARRAFLTTYDKSIERLRQADHCIGCGECLKHCPQGIAIPDKMHMIEDYTNKLKDSLV